MRSLRLIFMGTGPFAVPSFVALQATRHLLVALFTRPLKGGPSRGGEPQNPMRAAAEKLGIPIHAPESINTADSLALLKSLQADLFVVCDYGQILSADALACASLGGVNLHGSLLPKYRGAAPIQWALYQGEAETGVTVIHMTPRLDGGPCLGQVRTPIGPEETAETLEPRLAQLGVELLLKCVDALSTGTAAEVAQDGSLVTKAPRILKQQGAIDWNRTAQQLHHQLRAFTPWPKSFSYWLRGEGEPLRVVVEGARVIAPEKTGELAAWHGTKSLLTPCTPGVTVATSKAGILVGTGAGWLVLTHLQPAGKKVLTVGEFLNGYPVQVGDRWGEPQQANGAAG